MITAILIDFSLVLVLEFTRGATQTALSLSLTPLQQVHIISSSIATLLYLPILILGWKRWNGSSTFLQDQWHLKLGLLAFIFRTIGFILMFTLLNHVGRL